MNESNRRIISVSELNKHAKRLLESEFPLLFVEGEISNFARPRSGHWYFTLKDEKAQIRCAMFKNRNQTVKFEPKDGQQVIVRGRISLYEGRGEFQLIAEFLEDSGDGALRRAFDKLKDSLQAEGLFDEDRKKRAGHAIANRRNYFNPGRSRTRCKYVVRRRFLHSASAFCQCSSGRRVCRTDRRSTEIREPLQQRPF